ncbi:hypothetical protein MGSAQ_001747, partial [marine sediment metagenome]
TQGVRAGDIVIDKRRSRASPNVFRAKA